MNTPCVLVTGVGAIIGQGIIKSLRMVDRPVRVIGLDRNSDAFGARHCDVFYAKPKDESGQEYIEFFRELVNKEGVDLILPGIEHDVFFFDAHRIIFEQLQSLPVLNSHTLIEVARDKWKTAEVLMAAGIQEIPGIISNDWEECISELGSSPLLLKPLHGNGSRGIVTLHDEQDLEYWSKKASDTFMLQRIVGTDNEEYTSAVFGFGEGESTSPIVFKRRLGSDGSTSSAEIVQDPQINALIGRLNKLLEPLGPTNYQFRKESNKVYLLEVNPRISSATSLRAAFDYNEAWMCIDYFINGVIPSPQPKRKGRAVRYVEDFIEHL